MKRYTLVLLLFFLCYWVFSSPQVSLLNAEPIVSLDSEQYDIQARTVLSELNHPWGIAWLPAHLVKGVKPHSFNNVRSNLTVDYFLIVTERNGEVWIISPNGDMQMLSIPVDVYKKGQGGWLDVGTDKKGRLYVAYARKLQGRSTTALIQFSLEYRGDTFKVVQVKELFEESPSLASHLHFGGMISITDRYVFLSLGDRGQRYEAQNTQNHIGSIVRLNLDGTIPSDNPFLTTSSTQQAGAAAIYSFGHRNVQGLYFDRPRNLLFANEHGPQGGDELNGIFSGLNYGWPEISYGREYGSGKKIGEYEKEGMEQPIRYWDPSPAFSGLFVYYGDMFPKWNGDIFLGALKYQRLYRLKVKEESGTVTVLHEEQLFPYEFGRVRNIRQGPDDAIYVLTDEANGKVIKLEIRNN